MKESHTPTPANHFSGDTQAERTTFWADAARSNALDFEERARSGDPYFNTRAWVDGHVVDWWQPEVEHLKRTGQLGLALDLAWRCMEAAEEATLATNVNIDARWAWEAAVIARKMRNHGLEVEIINRILDIDAFITDQLRGKWESRLVKAEQLAAKARG